MIDIEADVLAKVREYLNLHADSVVALRDVRTGSEAKKTPASFPFVSLMEKDNYTDASRRTSNLAEEYADIMYEVNVYSNKEFGKKSECRTIASYVDEAMIRMGFNRISLEPMVNLDDASIYRIVGRYRAKVSRDRMIYRR